MQTTMDLMYQPGPGMKANKMLKAMAKTKIPYDIPGNFRAKQRRTGHDNSDLVFPKHKKSKGKPCLDYQTHYTMNFKNKLNGRPSSPRPCSPTRRNNPHPSKNFLNWRIPTRVYDYGKEKMANVAFLKSSHNDTHNRFYDDYYGPRTVEPNSGEVDPKLLLEVTKAYGETGGSFPTKVRKTLAPLGRQRELKRETILPKALRNSWSPQQSSRLEPLAFNKKADKAKKAFTPMFIKPEFEPFFRSWYDAVSPTEQGVIEDVLEKAEDSYLKQALSSALKPNAVEAIEAWLMSANEEERAIAMDFIQALLLASEEGDSAEDGEQGATLPHPDAMDFSRFMPMLPMAGAARNKKSPGHTHHDHHTMKSCIKCQKDGLEEALQQLQAVATMPTEVSAITELLNPLHPAVIQEREMMRKAKQSGTRVLNRPRNQLRTQFKANKGSLFVTSNSERSKCKHFTIHPEWN